MEGSFSPLVPSTLLATLSAPSSILTLTSRVLGTLPPRPSFRPCTPNLLLLTLGLGAALSSPSSPATLAPSLAALVAFRLGNDALRDALPVFRD